MGLTTALIYIWVLSESTMPTCTSAFMGIHKLINSLYLLDVKVHRLDLTSSDHSGILDFLSGDWISKFAESFRWHGWGDNGGWSWFPLESFCGGFVFIFCAISSASKMYDHVIS